MKKERRTVNYFLNFVFKLTDCEHHFGQSNSESNW